MRDKLLESIQSHRWLWCLTIAVGTAMLFIAGTQYLNSHEPILQAIAGVGYVMMLLSLLAIIIAWQPKGAR